MRYSYSSNVGCSCCHCLFCYQLVHKIQSLWLFQVTLHFWGTGGGALPVVSFLFIRDLCIRLGSDCLDECFKGIYRAYVLNCQFVNAVKLQHIQFLGNCVIELLGVDLPIAYQHAFVFIRQLGMILREALNMRTKVLFPHFPCMILNVSPVYEFFLVYKTFHTSR